MIVGCGGSGKSTLAVEMGAKLDLPVVHLDKLWWLRGWVERDRAEFDSLLAAELAKPEWIIEGNFSRTFAERLRYAELCIFLDYPTELCLASIQARIDKYAGVTRPDMAEGCPERNDGEFAEWVQSFNVKTRPKMLETLKNSGVPFEIFTSREQTAAWLDMQQ